MELFLVMYLSRTRKGKMPVDPVLVPASTSTSTPDPPCPVGISTKPYRKR